MSKINKNKIKLFEEAFSSGTGGSVRHCECGKRYYNSDGDWDWEEKELEKLQADKAAIDIDYTVWTVIFEGKEYVMACDCWHERAMKVMQWLDSHRYGIAGYFKAERERIESHAKTFPLIET